MMLQPSRAPSDGQPPATEAQSPEGTAGGGQEAPPPGGMFGGMGMILLPLVLMVGLMLFMSRSDKKRREKLESSLKKGDRVLTQAGFIGKLVEVGDTELRVEIAPGVVVKMVKSAVQGHADADGAGKAAASKAASNKALPSGKDAKHDKESKDKPSSSKDKVSSKDKGEPAKSDKKKK